MILIFFPISYTSFFLGVVHTLERQGLNTGIKDNQASQKPCKLEDKFGMIINMEICTISLLSTAQQFNVRISRSTADGPRSTFSSEINPKVS